MPPKLWCSGTITSWHRFLARASTRRTCLLAGSCLRLKLEVPWHPGTAPRWRQRAFPGNAATHTSLHTPDLDPCPPNQVLIPNRGERSALSLTQAARSPAAQSVTHTLAGQLVSPASAHRDRLCPCLGSPLWTQGREAHLSAEAALLPRGGQWRRSSVPQAGSRKAFISHLLNQGFLSWSPKQASSLGQLVGLARLPPAPCVPSAGWPSLWAEAGGSKSRGHSARGVSARAQHGERPGTARLMPAPACFYWSRTS